MTILEYLDNQSANLEDSLQHYTMVDKDKCKEIYIRTNLEHLYKIKTVVEAWQILCEKASIEFMPTITLDGIKRHIDFAGNYSEEDTDKLIRAVALGRGLYEGN